MKQQFNSSLPETFLSNRLSPEERTRLLQRNALIEQYRFLPLKYARGLIGKLFHLSLDEAIACGMYALVRAADHYKEGTIGKKGLPASFTTYATRAIVRAILEGDRLDTVIRTPLYLTKSKSKKKASEEVLRACSKAITTQELFPNYDRQEETASSLDKEEKTILEKALTVLTGRELLVIRGYYWQNREIKDLGRELGMTKQGVHAIKRRALLKLRSYLDRNHRDFGTP